jgi:hypothetical protein
MVGLPRRRRARPARRGHGAAHRRCIGWNEAPAQAITAFATASASLYAEIARDDPQPWKLQLAGAAACWLASRA